MKPRSILRIRSDLQRTPVRNDPRIATLLHEALDRERR
jgi:hypothetical protein